MEQNKKYRNRPLGCLIWDKGDCSSERQMDFSVNGAVLDTTENNYVNL